MNKGNYYKGWSLEPASDKKLNGKYQPRGQFGKKSENGENKMLKTFDGEHTEKKEADEAFIELIKKHIDINYND